MALHPLYLSKEICPLHPELNGERYPASGECTKCMTPAIFMQTYEKKGGKRYSESGTARAAAKLEGNLTYFGKVCDKHPDLVGRRYTVSGSCTSCANQRKSKKASSADNPHRYHGELCDRHPEEKGLRYRANNTCVACARERAKAHYERQKAKRNKEEVQRVIDRRSQ